MSLSKRISQFFTEILKIFLLILWWLCLGFSVVVFGVFFFADLMTELNKPPLSLLYKINKNYDRTSYHSYTPKHTIYDNSGNKVGTFEKSGEVEYYETTDERKYVPRYFLIILYMLYFPLSRVLAIIISFAAIFTNKFYVSANIPEDVDKNPYKYRRGLYTLFNIISERSPEEIKKVEYAANKKLQQKEENNRRKTDAINKFKIEHKEKVMIAVKFCIIAIISVIIAFIVNLIKS